MVILLERRCRDWLSSDSEHQGGLPALRRSHRQPLERSVHRLIHGTDWTRSLLRLLMRQVHDIRFVHCTANVNVQEIGSSLFPILLFSRNAPAKMCGKGVKSDRPGGRAAAPCLSHGAASLQWLGEVKAPDNISIVMPAALLGLSLFRWQVCASHIQNTTYAACRSGIMRLGVQSVTSGSITAGLCPNWSIVCALLLSFW